MLHHDSITKLIVHCSDTDDNHNIGAKEIHEMHLSFGWDGIGYHKIINRTGMIQNGRPEYWVGAHAKGINENSLGVCLIGRKKFTKEQYNSLESLLRIWKNTYKNAIIVGHRDAIKTNKTCPNFNVNEWCKKRLII